MTNNDWKETQHQEIEATGLAPPNDLESAILVSLNAGAYTAMLSGRDGGSGVALVEVYDLSPPDAEANLDNISTRAFVSTGNEIVIGGLVLGRNIAEDTIVVRGIGPSLTAAGILNALAD